MMNDTALAQMIVNKSPIEIKSLLYQTAVETKSWDSFVQTAEEVTWIAFPDKTYLEYKGTKVSELMKRLKKEETLKNTALCTVKDTIVRGNVKNSVRF
jgi:hypothetical protein